MAEGTVTVEAAPPNEAVRAVGRITFIDNAVDPTTGQIRIKAVFPNQDLRLWPGQFQNVTVTLKTDPEATVVPTPAVQNNQQGKNYVFVVTPDGTAEIRDVVVERQVAENMVIKEGLKPGEIVVTDGQLLLVGGARVSIKSGPGGPARGSRPGN
jgi:multidrug efflux system membrane fusion protein